MDTQQKYRLALHFIDEEGEDLTYDEVEFVADLIDDRPNDRLTRGECTTIRYMLDRRAGGWEAFNANIDLIALRRGATE